MGATCPYCRREIDIREDGGLVAHDMTAPDSLCWDPLAAFGVSLLGTTCEGSGLKLEESK